MAKLAAEGKFSGVVLLSHQGRTVLSRSYGMADKEKGIRNHEGVAFSLSSAGKPFHAVAILQLAQQGKVKLSDTVGTHLKGYAKDISEQVTIQRRTTSDPARQHLLGRPRRSSRQQASQAAPRAGDPVDPFNASRLNTTIAAVITSSTALAAMPGNVFLPAAVSGLPKDSVVNVTALVTLNEADLEAPAGDVPEYLMDDVNRGLRRVLGL